MTLKLLHRTITFLIALIWLINGFYCKVLNQVPRHLAIVERITTVDRPSAAFLTLIIGCAEILMAVWIITRIAPRFNAITQIVMIATMNMLEFILAPDLLLWGRFNAFFALLLIIVIYYNEFHLRPKTQN